MFVTLSDFSTYDSDAFFVQLNDAGMSQLEGNNDMKFVDVENYLACIPIGDLIAAYNQVHGTDY
jgi:hypothetical protein